MVRVLDLAGGFGGFAAGVEATGKAKMVGFVEPVPFKRRVLAKHWPGVLQHDKLGTLDERALARFGRIDLIMARYPVRGFTPDDSGEVQENTVHLWPDISRIIAAGRPPYVVVENIPQHRQMGLDLVLDELERLGYAHRTVGLPTGAIQAPHARERLWLLAYADGHRREDGDDEQPATASVVGTVSGAEVARALDSGNDGISHGLVRRFATRSPWFHRGDDGEWLWESGVPRTVIQRSQEPNRVKVVGGAGAEISPQMAYAVTSIILAEEPDL